MKKLYLMFLMCTAVLSAQKQAITLEDIWANGTFRTQYMNALNSMSHGDFYTVLNYNRETESTSVDKYSYKTLEKVATLVDSKDLPNLESFDNYIFSEAENLLVLGTDTEQIYRHSFLGKFYVYNIATKQLISVSNHLIQEPTLSPDGLKVAFVYQNNLFVKDLKSDETSQITFNGKKNSIINGLTDWVYEEEFAFVRAFQWSGHSDKIAFMRFDETDVPEFTMMKYGESLYPEKESFKYPKAGENNSKISLHLYNLNTKKTSDINLGALDQYYIPRMKFTAEADLLCVTTLNRHQNNLNLIFVDTNTLKSKLILNETDAAYIDITDNLTFLKDNSFLWTSEKDGFNHIYHYDNNGKLIKQITSGPWEVTEYYGYNSENKQIYYQSVEDGSINRTLYTIGLNGENKKRLGLKSGTNSAAFSNSFNYYINTFTDANTPFIFTLNDAKTGEVIKEVKNNNQLLKNLENYITSPKEFFTLKTKNGDFNAWMIKPSDFNPNKKYPLFMYQYSGPGSQSVSNSWGGSNDYWYQMLAQQGYIVACVDGRGTGFKGAAFKKMTYKELGKYEIEDQIEAANELGKYAYIDKNNIGIWGWSFGGYMSSLAITKGADTFKMAIAVAPVTSWRFYDTVYTERYMQTPQENESGYDNNSPINFTDSLKGKFLLVHGSGDDNVHFQNTMRMIESLVGSNKQFDLFVYPDKNHGIYGRYQGKGNVRLNLYEKMTTFIRQNLKTNN
ncbi:MAG: S9 family peptidase [Flavobacteriales bacterium CG03_land_8_20_14_0_80_35_15]|nr:MAG: S9 family peptidase [Flavobacteriaceae bacterium CG1_02_35_72]PIV16875.1 MAG: S9 family peptidase [Flavobacteriales bacterium CG03_land_8_20_14_0_80_35_15]PJA04631.1 MAG: S9 family peptidase [Flavobacteriales bacterium CG_4_10_14_0_2_um_filter_35_18]